MVVRGRVKNGRLIVDEPTDLPEGMEVSLVDAEPLTEDEIRRVGEARARGKHISHEEMRAKLDARKHDAR